MSIVTNIVLTPCCDELSEIKLAVSSSLNFLVSSAYRDIITDYCYTTQTISGPTPEGQGFVDISFEDFQNAYDEAVGRDDCASVECRSCEEPVEIPCCLEGNDFQLCVNLNLTIGESDPIEINDVYEKSETLYNGEYFYTYLLTTQLLISLAQDAYFFIVFDGINWVHYLSESPFDGINIPVNAISINNSNALVNNAWSQYEDNITSIFSTTCCKKHFLIENCINPNITFILQTPLDFNYPIGQILSFNLVDSNIIGVNCWKIISELETVLPEDNIVCLEILDCYNNCNSCLPSCDCTRALNNTESIRKLQYLDCDGNLQETDENVGSGKTSKKYCVLEWISEDIDVLNFGNCIDNLCPEIPLPKRVVTPGYNTPICTPAHYERIVCRYAEIKYKETLTKRYGIEDCCDDESLANDIKYELIHLQMLEDPEYVCVNNPRLCPPGCGYINMNIIHECPLEPDPEPDPEPEP